MVKSEKAASKKAKVRNGGGQKKAALKKSSKNAGSKAIRVPPKWARELHLKLDRIEQLVQKVQVTYTVNFYGGAGGVRFLGSGINHTSICDDHHTSCQDVFTVSQPPGYLVVQVGGASPTGGRIEVQVTEGSRILTNFSQNTYPGGKVDNIIIYTA